MTPPSEPRTFTEAARRAQLIGSAIEAVNELGYAGASLSAIAHRAHVAKSAIVYYFGTKDSLMSALMDHVFARMGESIVAAVEAHTTAAEQLRAYVTASLTHTGRYRSEVTAGVAVAVAHRDSSGVPAYLAHEEDDTAPLRQILRAGIDEGSFRDLDVAHAAEAVEAVLDVAVTTVQRDPDANLEKLGEELMRFIAQGLSSCSPEAA